MTKRGCLAAAALMVGASSAARAQTREVPLSHWQHSAWTGLAGPPALGHSSAMMGESRVLPRRALLRSPDGYLWLPAPACLLRFDGVRFTVIDSTTTPALRSPEPGDFQPLWVDRRGVMWIRGPGGAYVTYENGRFRRAFTLTRAVPETEDDGGVIWSVYGVPHRLEHGRLTRVPLPPAIDTTDIRGVRPDGGGGLWIGSRTHGLWHVSRAGAARQHATGDVRPLVVARDGTVWAVGPALQGTARLERGRWIPLPSPDGVTPLAVRFAYEDREGWIWFQTNAQGVARYRGGVVERFMARDELTNDRVKDVAVDPAGVVWVSTESGLDRLRPAVFAALDPGRVMRDGIGVSVAQDRGGGLWVIAPDTTAVFLLDGGILRGGSAPLSAARRFTGGGRYVHLLAPARRGGAWIKPDGGELLHLGADGGRQVVGAGQGLAKRRVVGALETTDGTLWLELQRGFGRLRNGRYASVPIPGLDTLPANAYVEDGQGHLWLAWGNQPVVAVLAGDTVVANVRVPMRHVDHFALEHGDTLWAASETGIARIIGRRAVPVRVPGLGRVLAGNVAITVGQGALWVSSSAGVARLRLADLHRAADGRAVSIVPQPFDVLDGLSIAYASPMDRQSTFTSPDGRVWVNTVAGLAVATREAPDVSRPAPRVNIEEATADGVLLTEGARVAPAPGRVDLHFTATGLALPERGRIEYRLDGADRAWVPASIPRVASYHQLRPGRYVFRVRAWSEGGVPTASEAALRFRVLPAWYQAWWFYALVAASIAAAAAAGALAWQRRRGRLAAERAQARFDATLAERTRVARELHDTLLGDMAGLAMQLSAGARRVEASGMADATVVELLSALGGQVQRTLVDARRSVNAMRTDEPSHDIPPLHARLSATAQRTFAGAGITAHVERSGVPQTYLPAVEREVEAIAAEAMMNARRHARCRTVTVSCGYERGELRVRVRDDGHGFDASRAAPTGHWGVIGMRERAASIGAALHITSALGAGTEVVLVMPAPGDRVR